MMETSREAPSKPEYDLKTLNKQALNKGHMKLRLMDKHKYSKNEFMGSLRQNKENHLASKSEEQTNNLMKRKQ